MTLDGRPAPVTDDLEAPSPSPFPTPGQPPPGVARRTGRHARPVRSGGAGLGPPQGYRPRHAAPDAPTEALSLPVDRAGPLPVDRAGSGAAGPSAPGPATDASSGPRSRVRIVLAERHAPTRAVRTVAEVEQQTETGEFLLSTLMRAQFALAVRLATVVCGMLVGLPVLLVAVPRIAEGGVGGVGLAWIVLLAVPFPVLLGLGYLYTRLAERNERDFAENVED